MILADNGCFWNGALGGLFAQFLHARQIRQLEKHCAVLRLKALLQERSLGRTPLRNF